jgi:hypothetical protein
MENKKRTLATKYKKTLINNLNKGFIDKKEYNKELRFIDNYINPKKSFTDWLRTYTTKK